MNHFLRDLKWSYPKSIIDKNIKIINQSQLLPIQQKTKIKTNNTINIINFFIENIFSIKLINGDVYG